MPSFLPLAWTEDLKCQLADIYDGLIYITEARTAIGPFRNRKPLHNPLLVWLGVIIVSVAVAVDTVRTWEGVAYVALNAMATGLCLIAAIAPKPQSMNFPRDSARAIPMVGRVSRSCDIPSRHSPRLPEARGTSYRHYSFC